MDNTQSGRDGSTATHNINGYNIIDGRFFMPLHDRWVQRNFFFSLLLEFGFLFLQFTEKKRVETKSMEVNLHVTPKIVSIFFCCFFFVFFTFFSGFFKVIFVVLPFLRFLLWKQREKRNPGLTFDAFILCCVTLGLYSVSVLKST